MKRVCVVGAGAAGLCAAKHLAENSANFKFTVFEQQGNIGGTWRYTSRTGTDENGLPVHSSMYKNLKTNLPMEIMAFPDLPYSRGGPSFVDHPVVLDYIEEYADKFNIRNHIKFHRKVNQIRLLSAEGTEGDLWKVDVLDVLTKSLETFEFDAVMICVGAYSTPRYPDIPGLETYPGRVMHSHDYRIPDEFQDMKVVVLGAGSSGVDLAVEIAPLANQVMLSHNKSAYFTSKTKPERLTEVSGIASINQGKVLFLDGSTFDADAIVLCTGYELTAPALLDTIIDLKENGRRFPTLYKHLIPVDHPTLAIFSVIFRVLPFPVFNQQILFLLSLWKGDWQLPTEAEMMEDIDKDFQKRLDMGWPVRYAHCIAGDLQWDLVEDMETIASLPKLPPHYKNIYEVVHRRRLEDPSLYRRDNFVLLDNSTFEHIPGAR